MLSLTLPKQYEGAQSDNSHAVKYTLVADAEALYNQAKENLLNVNRWGKFAGGLSAKFQLTDNKGDALYRQARINDYIKIRLPAAGMHYDWVNIEAIQETAYQADFQQIVIRVRPVNDPQAKEHCTEHFLTSNATSSFIVTRKNEKLTGAIHGRNELPNVSTGNFFYRIRNIFIGFMVMLGLNKPQWKALAKGLLTKGKKAI